MPLEEAKNGWFERHVVENLRELKDGQTRMSDTQTRMHTANLDRFDKLSEGMQRHESEDEKRFASVNASLESMSLVKKIVYGALALILAAFMSALVAVVYTSQRSQVIVPINPAPITIPAR